MAARKKNDGSSTVATATAVATPYDDFADELISSLNKEHGSRIAYNLSSDESPTHVKRWISTGSVFLDYIISNRKDGGIPSGRIIEIFGPPSTGKSHIATQIARSTQQMGGIVVYIDTETATSPENLALLGVDVSKRFIYVDEHCTEEVFKVMESTILKARSRVKDVPVTIIWDSVAATSPKAELDGEYDKDTIGLQARVISKSMRKITGILGENDVTLVCLNQQRTKIGVMYGDPMTTPGGIAIPYHASVRLKITGGQQIKMGDFVKGINIEVQTIKNKVAAPFRRAAFQIHFGKGIVEHEELFDVLREFCDKTNGGAQVGDKKINVEGTTAWKSFSVSDSSGSVIVSKKFHKQDFIELMQDPTTKPHIDALIEHVLARKLGSSPEEKNDVPAA